jgi:hypothetical protein
MSRKERRASRAERIRALLEAGDHAGARADAQAVLADAAAPEDERKAAADILSSLAPDRGVLAAGLLGVATAVVVALLVLVRG